MFKSPSAAALCVRVVNYSPYARLLLLQQSVCPLRRPDARQGGTAVQRGGATPPSGGRPAPLFANPTTTIFINEILYDITGTDAGEFIEVAGPAGTDLTGWSIVLYNGTGGASYDTDPLSGTIPSQQGGYGTVSISYPSNGIQNGSPDGVALVSPGGLVQFLCYEGTFTATTPCQRGALHRHRRFASGTNAADSLSYRAAAKTRRLKLGTPPHCHTQNAPNTPDLHGEAAAEQPRSTSTTWQWTRATPPDHLHLHCSLTARPARARHLHR